MNRIILFTSMAIFTASFSFAQQDQDNDEESTKIIIRKTEIINGDTTTEEKILTGKEAEMYQNNHDKMTKFHNGANANADIELEEEIRNENGNEVHRQHYTKKVIIRNDGKNDENAAVNWTEDERIVMDLEDPEGEFRKIEINGEKIIFTDQNGKEQVIEIEDGGTVQSISTDNSGKKRSRVIIFSDEKVETHDGGTRSVVSASGTTAGGKITSANTSLDTYPNPSDGKFTLEVDMKQDGKANIEIIDASGKTVYEDIIKGSGIQKKQIDLSAYGKGIYFINLKQKGISLSKKVVIE